MSVTHESVLKAIGNPNRFEILRLLSRTDQMCVGDIGKALKKTQAMTSHELRILVGCDLLQSKKENKFVYYSLNPTVVDNSEGHPFLNFKSFRIHFVTEAKPAKSTTKTAAKPTKKGKK